MSAHDEYERERWQSGCEFVAGADESGCGSLGGRVYAAVVIFPKHINYKMLLKGINDSKKKSIKQRNQLYKNIKDVALDWSVATASVREIDKMNIYWAKFLAVRRAINNLVVEPDFVLMDGDKEIPEIYIPQKAIVKGDSKSISIAAASILAKVDRDAYINDIAKKIHEDFDWNNNMAYYSEKHIDALKKHGKTKWHRQKYVAKYLDGSQDGK